MEVPGDDESKVPQCIARNGLDPNNIILATEARTSHDHALEHTFTGRIVDVFIRSEVDLEVLIDNELVFKVDHARGFDYAHGTVHITPRSIFTFRARELNIDRPAARLVGPADTEIKISIGTATGSNIPITDTQKRNAMGCSDDVPSILQQLERGDHSAAAWAATRLGAIGDSRATGPLLAVIAGVGPNQDSRDEWVQANAAVALAELGDPAVLPILVAAVEKLPNQDHYAHMFKGAISRLSRLLSR
jgi:hypothetical protein